MIGNASYGIDRRRRRANAITQLIRHSIFILLRLQQTKMCDKLVAQYVTDNQTKNPNDVTDATERAEYLRKIPYWTCYQPNSTNVEKDDPALCLTTYYDQLQNKTPSTPGRYLLYEAGFVPWVNDRGMKCINHVTGVFHDIFHSGPQVGQPKDPKDRSSPTQCNAACLKATASSTKCFQCVAQAVVAMPTLCPAYTGKTVDEIAAGLKDAVSCTSCIGQQALKVNKHGARSLPVNPTTEEEAAALIAGQTALRATQADYCWDCLLGKVPTHPFTQTPQFIVIMICVSILVLVACVAVIVVVVDRSKRKNTGSDAKGESKSTNEPPVDGAADVFA